MLMSILKNVCIAISTNMFHNINNQTKTINLLLDLQSFIFIMIPQLLDLMAIK